MLVESGGVGHMLGQQIQHKSCHCLANQLRAKNKGFHRVQPQTPTSATKRQKTTTRQTAADAPDQAIQRVHSYSFAAISNAAPHSRGSSYSISSKFSRFSGGSGARTLPLTDTYWLCWFLFHLLTCRHFVYAAPTFTSRPLFQLRGSRG